MSKEPRYTRVYSRNNLPEIKDWAYVTNLHECKSIETRWIAFYVNGNNASFGSFGVKCIPKEIKKIVGNKNQNITNIYRI